VVRNLAITKLLVLLEAQAAHPLALTELPVAVSVVLEVVAQRIRTELRVNLGTGSMVVRAISVTVAALPLPAHTEHQVEAKAALVAMKDRLDLVETEVGHLPALTELQVDLKVYLDTVVEAEHLRLHMVHLTANKIVLVVQLLEVGIKTDSEIMEEAERLLAVTELLVALRPVSEVVLRERELHPVRTELQVDLKMCSDVTEEVEHLPVLTVRLAVVRIGLVDLLQALTEPLAVDKEVLEELLVAVRVVSVDFLQILTELLAPVRAVLEEELTVVVGMVLVDLLQPLTDLLAAVSAVLEELMVAVILALADLLQAHMELLTAVTVILGDLLQVLIQFLAVGREILAGHLVAAEAVPADLLQVLTEHLEVDKEVLVEGLVAVKAVSVDLLQVLTELLVMDREVLGRLAVKHLPTLTEHLLAVRMVCMVEMEHLLAHMVHQTAEATVSDSEAEQVPMGLSPHLDPVQVADMEVGLAMTDLL
jgi:hypothetical protein